MMDSLQNSGLVESNGGDESAEAQRAELERVARLDETDPLRWYVVRTRPKAEHIAARQMERFAELEPFAPRMSYMKSTARGRIRWTEALFPGYCLVRFRWMESWRLVNSSPGVTGVVRFEKHAPPPFLAQAEVEDLKGRCGENAVVELLDNFSVGQEVELVQGPLRGMRALITRVLPAKQRLSLLMNMLGQERVVEVSNEVLASRPEPPEALLRTP